VRLAAVCLSALVLVIDCGPGIDTVEADRVDVIARNCEHVSRR